MTFTERAFVLFFVIVYALWLVGRRNYRFTVALLLGASLVFYGHHHPWLVALLLGYGVGDWLLGLWIARSRRPGWVTAAGVALNLLVLGGWKYTPLLLRTVGGEPPRDWLLPWGISFFTFTGIAYLVDVYRGVVPAERNVFRFCLFMSFFPHQVAGPILRVPDFLNALQPDTLPTRAEAPLEATFLVARGLFKKMVLADRLALAIDPFFAHVNDTSTAGVWALPYVYLYALQILFDFSGYTDMARGLALCFGFRWPENFTLPYLAGSVAEFWKRWHITLSQFLRDYLYIPLGGNRHSPGRTAINLMATMLLGGLWHGASWSFLLWGGLHGAFLVVHRLWAGTAARAWLVSRTGVAALLYRAAGVVLTFHLVCLAWCFFRLTVLAESLACVRKWIAFDADKMLVGNAADPSLWLLLAAYGTFGLLAHLARPILPFDSVAARPFVALRVGFLWGFALALVVLALCLAPGGDTPTFIYFQF